jgi:hypothetical protein
MADAKFKVGDRVRYVRRMRDHRHKKSMKGYTRNWDEEDRLELGKEYTVRDSYSSTTSIKLYDHRWWIWNGCFELVSDVRYSGRCVIEQV